MIAVVAMVAKKWFYMITKLLNAFSSHRSSRSDHMETSLFSNSLGKIGLLQCNAMQTIAEKMVIILSSVL